MSVQDIKSIQSTEDMSRLLGMIIKYGAKIAQNRVFVQSALAVAEKWLINDNKNKHKLDKITPPGVIDDGTAMGLAILNSAARALTDYNLSPATFRAVSEVLGRDLFVEKKLRQECSKKFKEQFGFNPPSFLVISPTKACNLRCIGCYADSDGQVQTLDWDLVDQLITDAHDLWGVQFITISGGEPLTYRSQGKTILDLIEKHPTTYFMMYTNGTLITPELARRIAALGNLVPAVSMEGWRERTDARRGNGVFDKAVAALDNLFEAGALIGVSLTATRENAEEILSEEFIDFIFHEKHAVIGWIFQYMPIGRAYTLDLMPTPQQRIWMWKQSWKWVREKRVFLADFWNHGTLVDGCLSAGGHGAGGYMYINWNGNVTPCVFVPYSPVNAHDIYANGGNLNDIYTAPFFTDIRNWQKSRQGGNLLSPCIIRDHHADLRRLISVHEPDPIDRNAWSAIHDSDYAEGLDRYAKEYGQIADKVWEKVYLLNEPLDDEEAEELFQLQIDKPLSG